MSEVERVGLGHCRNLEMRKEAVIGRYRFYTADVFTDRVFGGNPLAVLPDAGGLSEVQMLAVTREFNYSESIFALPPDDPNHTRRLRIFTPGGEIPFAGHPTIGAAHVLAAVGDVTLQTETTSIVFEEAIGPVQVKIRGNAGQPTFAQLTAAQLPEFGPEPPTTEDLAQVLSLAPADIRTDGFAPQAVSCGVPFLFVPVRGRDALRRAQLDRGAWQRVLSEDWASDLYLICQDPEHAGSDLRARMFGPSMGIDEDPATGAAATALAGYLGVRDDQPGGTLRWVVEQGVEMGRPSRLHLEADKRGNDIVEIRVGGSTVMVSDGWIHVP